MVEKKETTRAKEETDGEATAVPRREELVARSQCIAEVEEEVVGFTDKSVVLLMDL